MLIIAHSNLKCVGTDVFCLEKLQIINFLRKKHSFFLDIKKNAIPLQSK